MPNALTFVFGHTHKPGEKVMDFHGYRQGVAVLNTGGWCVKSGELAPLYGGAMILADEELNAISLRMYNEGSYRSHVSDRTPPCVLQSHVKGIMESNPGTWNFLNMTIEEEVDRRAKVIQVHRRSATA